MLPKVFIIITTPSLNELIPFYKFGKKFVRELQLREFSLEECYSFFENRLPEYIFKLVQNNIHQLVDIIGIKNPYSNIRNS